MPTSTLTSTGLHGQQVGTAVGRAAIAEFTGTFVLVLAIVTTAIEAGLNDPIAGAAYSSATVVLAGASALFVMVAALGPISGAHFNPAVTVALAVTGRFPWRVVPAYLTAQFAAGLLAALVAWAVDGPRALSMAGLGATAAGAHVGGTRVLLVEALVTFVLVGVVIAVAADGRISRAGAAVAIGAALGVAILISGPITGAGVNPARALGPMIVAGRMTDWWAYLIGPLLGGSAAALLHDRLVRR